MRMRHTLHALTVCVSLLPAASGYGRGGETGTLDELPDSAVATNAIRGSSRNLSPYYLAQEHFRRLRARLSVQPLAPIPGWDAQRAWRFQDRYFTEDQAFEILPLVNEPVR